MSPVALPTLGVEIAFATGANPNAWHLGVTSFPATLAPEEIDTWTDVTDDVRSLSLFRGKPREADQFQAGRCNVTLNNRERAYDPLHLSGPHVDGGVTQVKPGRRLRVRATHPTTATVYDVFKGTIRDWRLDYVKAFDGVAQAIATDAMTDLANTKVDVTTSAAASGTAVREVLAAAQISASSSLDDGNSTLQAMTFENTALAALRTIEQTEQGALYVERDGTLSFLDRGTLRSEARHTTSQATFGAGSLSYEHIEIAYETDVMKNRVTVTRQGGVQQEASDADSIAEYGERVLQLSDMASANDTDALSLASYLVSRLSEPQVRVTGIAFHPQKHADLMTQALSRRLLDRVTVQFSPPGGGDAISQEVLIIGIQHDIRPALMETRFTLAPVSNSPAWVLGVGELGDTTGATATALAY